MAKQQLVVSHWYQLVEQFQASPLGFYEALEAALQRREVPEILSSRIDFKEGGLLTANRQYVRMIRGRHSFDICAAPFGTGFFFSWWLTEIPPSYGILLLFAFVFVLFLFEWLFFNVGFGTAVFLNIFVLPLMLWGVGKTIKEEGLGIEDTVIAIPVLGSLYVRIFQPTTYYKIDTALMFQQAVHNAVLEVVDNMISAKGLRALSESERKPILATFASQ